MHTWLIKILFSIGMITAGIAICILSHYQKTSDERTADLWSGDVIDTCIEKMIAEQYAAVI